MQDAAQHAPGTEPPRTRLSKRRPQQGRRDEEELPGMQNAAQRARRLTGPAGLEPATPGFGDRCSTS